MDMWCCYNVLMNWLRRLPSWILLTVGLVAVALSVVGVRYFWATVLAALVTAAVLVSQYYNQGPTVIQFAESDWKSDTQAGFRVSFPPNHGKGKHPLVAAYVPSDLGGYEQVECDVRTDMEGSVTLGAARPFVGEVRIG